MGRHPYLDDNPVFLNHAGDSLPAGFGAHVFAPGIYRSDAFGSQLLNYDRSCLPRPSACERTLPRTRQLGYCWGDTRSRRFDLYFIGYRRNGAPIGRIDRPR